MIDNPVMQHISLRRSIAPRKAHRIRLAAPPCTVGITDGSERGDYVPQDHLLRQFARPHHVVNLMFQYYPDMAGWPTQGVKWHGFYRNNALNKGDGYFPLALEEHGPWGQLFLRQIADVRAHGQEPQLTLTLHADTPDDVLKRIALSLAPFAPMRIRINHECNGVWFYFNQRWSYREVNDLFIRFHNILHEFAPGVQTVACWNGPGESLVGPQDHDSNRGQLTEDQMAPMFRIADIISFDQYASLHYGWPDPSFDPAKPTMCFRVPFDAWWKMLVQFEDQIAALRGGETPIEVHEVNEDANLVGHEEQARWITRFYREVVDRKLPWLKNITFYQFRDRGGLGLEWEDAEDPSVYRELPALDAYRAALADATFAFRCERLDVLPAGPAQLTWRSAIDSEGAEFTFDLPAGATSAELVFPGKPRVLVGAADTWRICESGCCRGDLPRNADGRTVSVQVFAPPPDGTNNSGQSFTTSLDTPPMMMI